MRTTIHRENSDDNKILSHIGVSGPVNGKKEKQETVSVAHMTEQLSVITLPQMTTWKERGHGCTSKTQTRTMTTMAQVLFHATMSQGAM